MILWRISNHVSLTGDGGLRASGRWHTRGKRVAYCAETPAAALLEILVHLEIEIRDLPARYKLLKIDAAEAARIQRITSEELPAAWQTDVETTRAVGDAWLRKMSTPLLAIPSAIVPETFNVLINPTHPDAKHVVVIQTTDHAIDPRLLR